VSKADPFRKGVVIYLGRTDNDLCPVGAIAAYLAVRYCTEQASGSIFQVCDRCTSVKTGLGDQHESSLAVVRGGCIQVCGTQFPNWYCYFS